MLKQWLLPVMLAVTAGFPTLLLSQDAAAPNMWNLIELYPTTEAFDQALARTRTSADKLSSYQGTLGGSRERIRSHPDLG